MNIEDLSYTIVPKSDQLNADDMIAGPMTITVAGIKEGPKDQPVFIEVDGRMPYKPCLTMRRALIAIWGSNGKDWIGRSMTLYCDPTIRFGPNTVGGIRISHMSHINEPVKLLLTTSRARRTEFTFHPLIITNVDYSEVIKWYNDLPKDQIETEWAKLSSDEQAAIVSSTNN